MAHHAGVGVGTAYRRFANKEELIDAILVQQVDDLEAILREALATPDAWNGLAQLYRRYLWIALDGLRASTAGTSRLPVAALTVEQTHTLLQYRAEL